MKDDDMDPLNTALADLAERVMASAKVTERPADAELMTEAGATLRTLALTLAKTPAPQLSDPVTSWTTAPAFVVDTGSRDRDQLAEALGLSYDEDEVPDDWSALLDRVVSNREHIREDRDRLASARSFAERVRQAAGAAHTASDFELVARIQARRNLVADLARSLELNGGRADLPAAITVAVANLKALVRRQAQDSASRTSTGHDAVVRVIKALGTWSPGHEAMDTIELGDAAVHVAGELAKDAEAFRKAVDSLTEDRGRVNAALGLGHHAPLADALSAVAMLQSSAQDSPDGLADRIAAALGVVTGPEGWYWTDESLEWLVEQAMNSTELHHIREKSWNDLMAQVADLETQAHQYQLGMVGVRTELHELSVRYDRMREDREAERASRNEYLRGLREIASQQAGGELVTDEGAALVRRVADVVTALVGQLNEASERGPGLASETMRNRVADALGFRASDVGRDWTNLLGMIAAQRAEHLEHLNQGVPAPRKVGE